MVPCEPKQCEIWNRSRHKEFVFKAGTVKKKGEGRDNKNKLLFLYDKQLDLETYPPTKFHSLFHLFPGKQQLLRSYRNQRRVTGFLRFTEKEAGIFVRIKARKDQFARCYTHQFQIQSALYTFPDQSGCLF